MIYKVPFDFRHEEKIFGGYLSLRQMLYLILSIISIGILFTPIPITLKTIVFFIIVGIFLAFAFLKIGNIYADKYCFNVMKYIFKKKIYINER